MIRPGAATVVVAVEIRRIRMRRLGLLVSLVVMALMGLVALGPTTSTRAQDATPLAGGLEVEVAPGVTSGTVPPVPGESPAATLARFRFASQASYTVFPGPRMGILYVEAGELVFYMDAPVPVMRGVAPEAPVEVIAANTQVTLGPGDYLILRPNM